MNDIGFCVSVLFNEPKLLKFDTRIDAFTGSSSVSVLFNEPKLLKSFGLPYERLIAQSFSALQRAEIAEILETLAACSADSQFQCSSTSRNC